MIIEDMVKDMISFLTDLVSAVTKNDGKIV